MSIPKPYCITEGVEFPDWLFDLALSLKNKEFITHPDIVKFINDKLLPIVALILGNPDGLHATASHVHWGADGLIRHNHLPHEYTSVLYYEDNDGLLILHLDDGDERIRPAWGRFVLMDATLEHSVLPSNGLRMSLVTNYATKPL